MSGVCSQTGVHTCDGQGVGELAQTARMSVYRVLLWEDLSRQLEYGVGKSCRVLSVCCDTGV